MSAIETLRELSEVWSLFGDMPDETTLGVDLAALYLGISVKTLARYRQNGDGPPYIQYQAEGSRVRNQRVNYLLGDLRVWRDSHKVRSTMHAAQVRGLTFTSLADFAKPQPFWTASSGNERLIIDHALTLRYEEFKQRLLDADSEVIWLPVEDAIFSQWENSSDRKQWHEIFVEHLNTLIASSKALQEKMVLTENIDKNN
ncbi:hypothetical protein SOV92_13005 [Pectobacterium brasiliense]|uniref:Transcriptional regulator n=1 Tax=Pectobacterium brasiliense TaxID=180957 RepID=A0AAW9H3B8_9GAMM|nr:hypothetical protein [Pectobacterium brasiliense]MDY4378742.1 hypothetical protein [Pectobacterium brasiliense]